MSAKKDVILIFHPMVGVGDALRTALPGVDIRDVITEDRPNATLYELLFRKMTEDELSQLKEADIVVSGSPLFVQAMYDLPKLKWAQMMDTGPDMLMSAVREHKRIPNCVVTRNIQDDIGLIMAEYVVGQIICHERSWHISRQNQREKIYDNSDRFTLFRSLHLITVGILGVGALGIEVARTLKHFRSRVIGYTRTPRKEADRSPYVDAYWHTGQLDSFLEQCDYVIGVLPSTPETKGFLGNDVLKDAKKHPVLMNVGRGDLISEKDVLRALEKGWISFAILDVFEKEPLPKDSSLWAHPKVLLTPHLSAFGSPACRREALAKCFSENYHRYKRGDSLLGVLDWNTGY